MATKASLCRWKPLLHSRKQLFQTFLIFQVYTSYIDTTDWLLNYFNILLFFFNTFSNFEHNLNKPQTQWSNKESRMNFGTSSNCMLLHMAVQVWSPLCTASDLSKDQLRYCWVNFEVPTLNLCNTEKEQLIILWQKKKKALNLANTKKQTQNSKKNSMSLVKMIVLTVVLAANIGINGLVSVIR